VVIQLYSNAQCARICSKRVSSAPRRIIIKNKRSTGQQAATVLARALALAAGRVINRRQRAFGTHPPRS